MYVGIIFILYSKKKFEIFMEIRTKTCVNIKEKRENIYEKLVKY